MIVKSYLKWCYKKNGVALPVFMVLIITFLHFTVFEQHLGFTFFTVAIGLYCWLTPPGWDGR